MQHAPGVSLELELELELDDWQQQFSLAASLPSRTSGTPF
jgi:hypothetical protein